MLTLEGEGSLRRWSDLWWWLLLLEGLQARPQRTSSWAEPVADARARFPLL
jgi:hypothetical protein